MEGNIILRGLRKESYVNSFSSPFSFMSQLFVPLYDSPAYYFFFPPSPSLPFTISCSFSASHFCYLNFFFVSFFLPLPLPPLLLFFSSLSPAHHSFLLYLFHFLFRFLYLTSSLSSSPPFSISLPLPPPLLLSLLHFLLLHLLLLLCSLYFTSSSSSSSLRGPP